MSVARRGIVFSSLLLALMGQGCGMYLVAPPPPIAHAPLIRAPGPDDASNARISAGLGVLLLDADGISGTFVIPGEASLTLHPARRYDLALTASSGMIHGRGLFALVDGPLRVGIIHGLGIGGYFPLEKDSDYSIFYGAEGGLLLSSALAGKAVVFGSAGYAYSDHLPDNELVLAAGTAALRAGLLIPMGDLSFSSEIGYGYRHLADFPDLGPTHVLLLVITIGSAL